jgi:photosystem II stability/assembly factor-like uncharacterized protein
LTLVAAQHTDHASHAMLLASARAGARIVAVGDHGVVLLSDDNGKTFRQARTVPVDAALTGVSFVDARQGWAVGHWGVILHSEDGGETWTVQRSDVRPTGPCSRCTSSMPSAGWRSACGRWCCAPKTVGANGRPSRHRRRTARARPT